jgi:gas vesicle protein
MGFVKRVVVFGVGGIVGGGIGAAVASLLAPQSGEKLQASVAEMMNEARAAGDAAKAETEREMIARFRDKVNDPTAFTGTASQ